MLNCKDCNYYQNYSGKSCHGINLNICDLADTLFLDDVEKLNVDYPCSKINFNDYLRKKTKAKIDSHTIQEFIKPELFQELKECGACMLKFPDGITEKCFEKSFGKSKCI